MAKNVNIKLGANIKDFESKMKRAQRTFKKTAKNLKKVGQQMTLSLTAPLTAFAAASVKAFDTQAKAEAQLRTALQDNETAFKNLTDQAKELQEISLFGDEEIIAQQAYLASLGLTEDKIKDVISASMDLAAGTGQTLEFGVKNLAKTFSGLTGELGESIPALKELTTEELKAGEAVKVVADAFKGQAKAAADAGLGGVQQLKNSFDDLTEEIGMALMPVLDILTDKLKKVIDGVKTLTDAQIKSRAEIGLFVIAIGPIVYALGQFFEGISKVGNMLKWLARSIIIPVVIGALDLLIGGLAVAVATFGGPVVAAVGLLITAFTSLAHTFLTATDEQVKFNAAQRENIVLTKEQAEAIDNISVPFVEGAERAKEFGIQLDKVAQVTSIDAPDGLATGLKETTHILKDVEGTMSNLGATAVGVFDRIVDRVLQFRGSFTQVLEEIGIMVAKMILKMTIMAAIMSVISGGGAAGKLGFSFAEAFNMQLGVGSRASGGNVIAGQPYIVGEKGPEMFMPGQSGTIIPNNNLGNVSIPDVRISGEDLIIVFDRAKRHRNALG